MDYTKYLRWIIIGGLCSIPFIAFIVATGSFVPSMFFPFITGKNFAFRILVELLLLAYIILALREPQYRPRSSWLLWTAGAFVLWMGVATLMSVDPIKSFWSNFERMDGYISLIHMLALFVIAGAVLSADRLWERFFQSSVAASVLMGAYGVLQLFHAIPISSQSGPRIDTTFGNATYLAVYMLFNVFITLFLMARILEGGKKLISRSQTLLAMYGVALLLQVVAIYYTETRGAILGLLGGLVLAALYTVVRARAQEWQTVRRISLGTLAVIAVLVVTFLAVKDTSFIRSAPALSRLASISLSDPTTQSRFIIWNIAFQGFTEKPIFGWGQENFNFVYNEHYSPEMYNQEQWFDRAHNQFLDWLIAGGALAFVLYVGLFVLFVIVIARSELLSVIEQATLIGLIGAYAFNNLFVFDNLMSEVYFFVILAFAHGLSRKSLPGWIFLSKPGSDQMIAVAAPVAAVLLLGGAWMLNAPGITRAQVLIDALTTNLSTGGQRNPQENFASFEKALTYGPLGLQETTEQLFQFASNSIAPSTSVSPELKQNVYAVAHTAGDQLLEQRPGDARLELFMSVFLLQYGKGDEAIDHLKKALTYSPNKQQILFELGSAYLQKGDTQTAEQTFKKSFELATKNDDARIIYAIGLYSVGKVAQADALLKDGFGNTVVDDSRLLQAYANLKMYNRVVAIWLVRVEKNPKDSNAHMGLASAYFASNNIPKTIEELQKAEQVDPALAPQVEPIITQIKNGTLKPPQ